ncbi:hypothetical protein [Micromonospora sp. NBC_01796]|uniref:hypothetical protein n=1 Tax=Micromonospora sp. NBC_01796 TaxID=2975987 RepID=UPI002DD7B25A|nr:hypothetical protein [Micromonospora sp. NBC_01796]WSA83883.1 hypothetical protein OIE47_26410 [Micromonospora sp. NBC_01796]
MANSFSDDQLGQGSRFDALLTTYRDSAHESVEPPPAEWIAATGRQRARRRTGVALAAAVLAVTGATGLVLTQNGSGTSASDPLAPAATPGTTGPSPTTRSRSVPPTGSGSTGDPPAPLDLREVDWRRATVQLPADRAGSVCPTGRITTRGEETKVGSVTVKVRERALTLGDLDRDGHRDAVINFHCERNSDLDSSDGSGQLLVVTERDGRLVGLGYAGPQGENYVSARVNGGVLLVTLEQRYGDQTRQERGYRWNGDRFVQVSGPTTFPNG